MISPAIERRGSPAAAARLVRILHVEDNPRDVELLGETLVEQSGGRIEVSSEIGRGTLFRVRLPAIRSA